LRSANLLMCNDDLLMWAESVFFWCFSLDRGTNVQYRNLHREIHQLQLERDALMAETEFRQRDASSPTATDYQLPIAGIVDTSFVRTERPDPIDDDQCCYVNAATCPDCGTGMVRLGVCFSCPACGWGSCC